VWCAAPGADEGVAIVFLHGGSFTDYSPDDAWYRSLASRLAVAARCRVLLPAYRLAPAHPLLRLSALPPSHLAATNHIVKTQSN